MALAVDPSEMWIVSPMMDGSYAISDSFVLFGEPLIDGPSHEPGSIYR
jgi:hypothetical protein